MEKCGECGGRSFSENDLGEQICNLCGTANVQHLSQSQVDDSSNFLSGLTAKVGRGGRYVKRVRKKKVRLEAELATLTPKACLQAYAWLLQEQAKTLVDTFGCSSGLPGCVRQVWFAYLKHRLAADASPVLWFTYSSMGRKRRHYTSSRSPLDLRLGHSLAICLIACRWRREAIFPAQLVLWAETGRLPFIAAFDSMPEALRSSVERARPFFTQVTTKSVACRILSPGELELVAADIGRAVCKPLPPLNLKLATVCLAAEVCVEEPLPVLLPVVVAICELLAPDFARWKFQPSVVLQGLDNVTTLLHHASVTNERTATPSCSKSSPWASLCSPSPPAKAGLMPGRPPRLPPASACPASLHPCHAPVPVPVVAVAVAVVVAARGGQRWRASDGTKSVRTCRSSTSTSSREPRYVEVPLMRTANHCITVQWYN